MNDVAPMRQLSPVSQPISPAKFAHFVLRTGQFDKMIGWYQTVLAARIVFRDERLCWHPAPLADQPWRHDLDVLP
jgi:hypothetical protein